MKSVRHTCLMTPEQHALLLAAAKRTGRSLSNYLVTAAIRAAMAKQGDKK